jgi:hypothetical protein
MVAPAVAARAAAALREAIQLAERGDVPPLDYSDVEQRVLQITKERGQIEPSEAIQIFDAQGWEHFDEHGMWTVMENLRDRFPYRLSHAGPRQFAYHDLSGS